MHCIKILTNAFLCSEVSHFKLIRHSYSRFHALRSSSAVLLCPTRPSSLICDSSTTEQHFEYSNDFSRSKVQSCLLINHSEIFPKCLRRFYSSLAPAQFEKVSEDTLESLCEKFEELNELECCPADFDVTYAAGVLTVQVGGGHGTYVINKQTPNAQIWFSSPMSGPKRFDFIDAKWVYSHDDSVLHELLSTELHAVFGKDSNFSTCAHSS